MKKISALILFVVCASVYAQQPAAGSRTAELNLNFQSSGSTSVFTPVSEFRFRQFINGKSAIRIKAGVNSQNHITEVSNGTLLSTITEKSGFKLKVTPGFEYHFNQTGALSPYIGGQVGITWESGETRTVTNAHVSSPTLGDIISGDFYKRTNGQKTGFDFGLFLGADYYLTPRLYAGTEFGIGLFAFSNTLKGETRTKNGNREEVTPIEKSNYQEISGIASGQIRLGFLF